MERQLTDEERRQKLSASLRKQARYHESLPAFASDLMLAAADEIERLAAEVEAMMDCDNQKLLEAEMRSLALSEEIEYQHKEIERLAANQKDEYGPPLTEAEQIVNILRHAEPMYVGMNIRRQAADEIERLGWLAEENERLARKVQRLEEEILRLRNELELAQDEKRFVCD